MIVTCVAVTSDIVTSVTVGVLTSDQIASLTGMNNIQAGNVSTEDDEEEVFFSCAPRLDDHQCAY